MRETACGAGVPEGSVAVPGSGRTSRRARSELSSSLGQERGVLQVDAGRRGGACHLTLCVRRAALRSERTGVTVALPSHFPVQHLTTFIKWTFTTKNFPLFILSTSVSTRIRGHLVRSVLNPPLPQTRPAGTSDWSPCPVTHFRRLLSQPRRVLPPPTQSAISPGGTGPRGHGLPVGGVACPVGGVACPAGRGLPVRGVVYSVRGVACLMRGRGLPRADGTRQTRRKRRATASTAQMVGDASVMSRASSSAYA